MTANQAIARFEKLTDAEFIADQCTPDENGMTARDYDSENLGERESQHRSECAMFGDSGPGQWLTIREIREELAYVDARIERLSRPLEEQAAYWNRHIAASNQSFDDCPF